MTNNNLLVPLTITAALIAAAVAIKTHFFGKKRMGTKEAVFGPFCQIRQSVAGKFPKQEI